MRKIALFLLVFFLFADRAHTEEEQASIEDLAGKLASGDLKEREHAAWNLWLRRADAAPAASALAAAILDEDQYVRETAARAVQYLLIRAPQAVPVLVRGLTDERVEVRRLASEMLAWCYDHVAGARADLMTALAGDADDEVRANCAASLRLLPSDSAGPAIPALVKAAGDPAASVRRQVVLALGWLRSPELLRLTGAILADPDAGVREAMLNALVSMPDLPDCFVERAAAMTRDPDSLVRRRAAFLLGRFEGRPGVAVPALLAAIRDEASLVRIAAAVSMATFGAVDARIPPALGHALEEREYWLTKAAATSLGRTGPAAAGQLPALATVIRESPDMEMRYAAVYAIEMILGPAIEEVADVLDAESGRDPDACTILAAAALLRIRGRDEENLRCLLEALGDESLGDSAARLLGDLERAVQPAVPELLEMARGEDLQAVRANFVLIRVAVLEAEDALGWLRAVLESPGDPRKLHVLRRVGSLGPAAAPLVPVLVDLVKSGDPDLVAAAADALGFLGPAARAALPALSAVAESPNSALAVSAQLAIRRISPEGETSGDGRED